MNILSTDVGSLPPTVDINTLEDGAIHTKTFYSLFYKNSASEIFEQEVVGAFIDKLDCVDMPVYPQFRDMNEMFKDLLLSQTPSIPEVDVLKNNLSKIRDAVGYDVPIGVCITGPYTLSIQIKDRAISIESLTNSLCKILENTLFKNKYGGTTHICIDEPVLGFLNDPILDFGSPKREILRNSWEKICKVAKSKNVETGIHIHNTSDGLFWDVEHLDIIESHVSDSIYSLNSTKERLEETDKFLRASVAITDFDKLIMMKVGDNPELLANCWNEIKTRKVNPNIFLEDKTIMEKRLKNTVARFGSERIPYFGAECGFKGFPSYDCALDYLWEIHRVNVLS